MSNKKRSTSKPQSASPSTEDTTLRQDDTAFVADTVAQQLYALMKDGTPYPGYALVPSDKASRNPTVDTVLGVVDGQAVCKLKKDSDKKFITTGRSRIGLVTDKGLANSLSSLGLALGLE